MQDNFKRNLIIQLVIIVPLLLIVGLGDFTIHNVLELATFCLSLAIVLFFLHKFCDAFDDKIFYNCFMFFCFKSIILIDIGYFLSIFSLAEFRCSTLLSLAIIRNTYIFITKLYRIKGYKDNNTSANDNEQ